MLKEWNWYLKRIVTEGNIDEGATFYFALPNQEQDMNEAEQNRLAALIGFVPQAVAAIAGAMGVLVLLGWLFGLDAFKSMLPGLTAMKANTALGFLLSGIALWTVQENTQGLRVVAQICAGVVVLLGLLTLGEYLSEVNFGIDQLLIREITNLPGDIPGRMAVNTALSFAALGAALLLLSRGKGDLIVVIHVLVMVPIVAAGSALIGYSYDIEAFLRAKLNYTPMAANTAAVFVLLALGVATARPDYPFRRFMTSDSAAGVTVRRLLPAMMVFTLMTGWLIQQGYDVGYFSEAFGLALFTAASVAGLGSLILWNAGRLYEVAALREQTEKSLRENEEQLNAIIKILPVGLWILSAEGKVVFSNDAAQRIWAGVRYVGIVQLGEYKGWWPDSGRQVAPHEWAGARAVEKGETSIEEEIEIECFDGTHKFILDSAVPLRRSDGSIRGAITVNFDITERKRAEEERRSASLYARSLLEASLDPLVTISAEGKITDVNEAAVQATGVPRKLLVGSDFSEYFTEPDKARAGYREVFAKGFVTDYPLALRHVSGKVTEVLYNASVYRDVNGEVAGVFAAARDITERKLAEEQLREASIYVRSLLEASLDPLVTISAEGKITDVNEAAVQATGVPRKMLVGSDFSEYFTEPDKARAGYQAVFAQGFVMDYPLALRHVSGKITEVLYNASVYRDVKGEVAGVFAAARDITELKRAENELRKYHEHLEELVRERTSALETANKDLEGFAYSVSHDLRVPLRAVDGFSQQVLKRYADKLDDEGKRYLNVVRDNTKKMGQLIDDILAFSRMGRLGMSISGINMEELAHAVFKELKANLAGRELTMEIKSLPLCHGDLSMLRQVWINLLGNAIKFTQHREAPRIEVGGHAEATENIYYVKDNGAGFDMQYADKLFGVFQRLHGVDEFEGTGIGLAIVKRIVTRHGGRVWAEGKVDEGATIYFALPNKETYDYAN